MVRRARALGLIVAIGSASACNPNASGLGGGDTAEPVDPSSTGTSTGAGATTSTAGSTTSTTEPVDGTEAAASTSDGTTTGGSATSSSGATDTSTEPMVVEHCTMPDLPIPDAPAEGPVSMIDVPEYGTIVELRVVVRAEHPFVGDLRFELTRGPTTLRVIDLPGVVFPNCNGDDIDVVLRDDAAATIDEACLQDPAAPPALAGNVQPDELLAPAFVGQPTMGSWELRATDNATMDDGRFIEWCLQIAYQ